jgi:hypothetical protein
MRPLFFSSAVIAGVCFGGVASATAGPLGLPGSTLLNSQAAEVAAVETIGWRRQLRRYGYPLPYAYYPPAYGYYAPPPAYAYYPPAYDTYAPPAVAEPYAPPPGVAEGDYSSAEGDYADYPPGDGGYPPPDGY